jgi:hypothetical protein
MRRRLQYLLPDVPSARRTMDDLLLARVDERHIHALARRGTSMDGLHEASMLQKSDLVHGAQMGFAIGAALGTIVGLIVAYTMVGENGWQVLTVVASAIMGALFGAWVSSMVAIAVPNSRLREFQSAIDEGQVLLMVDVPEHRVEEIRERVGAHPEAVDRGLDPNVPAFP